MNDVVKQIQDIGAEANERLFESNDQGNVSVARGAAGVFDVPGFCGISIHLGARKDSEFTPSQRQEFIARVTAILDDPDITEDLTFDTMINTAPVVPTVDLTRFKDPSELL